MRAHNRSLIPLPKQFVQARAHICAVHSFEAVKRNERHYRASTRGERTGQRKEQSSTDNVAFQAVAPAPVNSFQN